MNDCHFVDSMINVNPSPMQQVKVDGFDIIIKRDDLLPVNLDIEAAKAIDERALVGNKARKFGFLLDKNLSAYRHLVSFGSAQSNGLLALACIAKLQGLTLHYFVDHISQHLQQHPSGNYQAAQALGVEIVAAQLKKTGHKQTLQQYVTAQAITHHQQSLFIPEGGHYLAAANGIYRLADEIIDWLHTNQYPKLTVMLPSGTGTMALFLQQRFNQQQQPIQVWTCACVGSDQYLRRQFSTLSADTGDWPKILNMGKKYHFGQLYPEFWQMWQKINKQTNIEFDLLYDPLGWLCLLKQLSKYLHSSRVVYIHQGGVLANQTMMRRYQRHFR